jgi:hypothetical protein
MRDTDAEAIRSGKPLAHEQRLTPLGDTRLRVFETIKTAVAQPDGKVLGVLGVARDMTERRIEQERTIRRQARMLQGHERAGPDRRLGAGLRHRRLRMDRRGAPDLRAFRPAMR